MLELAVLAVVLLALFFDFVNGFHDSANSIATIVATRVLTPFKAVAMAALFNFVAFMVFPMTVAATIGNGIVQPSTVTVTMVAAALVGAIVWDLVTWLIGLPTSSSHALMGGLLGAGVVAGGVAALAPFPWESALDYLYYAGAGGVGGLLAALVGHAALRKRPAPKDIVFGFIIGWTVVSLALGIMASLEKLHIISSAPVPFPGLFGALVFMVVSPLSGMGLAFLLAGGLTRLARRTTPSTIHRVFGKLQIVSAAYYSLNHGANDAQKTIGIITVLLLATGSISTFAAPLWIILAAQTAMALGTFLGGWRIVKTLAQRVTHLKPYQGFCAETAGGGILMVMAAGGVPVSTTHAITGSIMGVGALQRLSAVRWGVGRRIIWAWLFTIPASAIVAAAIMWLARTAGF